MARHKNRYPTSQPPKQFEEIRLKAPFVFSYAEWLELLATGKFNFTLANLQSAAFHPDGFIGYHHGYMCFIDIGAGLVGTTEAQRAGRIS